jgi:hypothetical protein
MLENGCPLDVIATVLGHDNLYVTAHCAQDSRVQREEITHVLLDGQSQNF